MKIQLARRMQKIKASEIRELLKLTQLPDMISFAGGLPAPETFPVEDFRVAMDRMIETQGRRALQYSTTDGDADLREAIAERMNRTRGTQVTAGEILITSGSQQGLDISGKILLDEGDVVLCESPTYMGAIQAFVPYAPRFIEIPTDDDGMQLDELEAVLGREDRVRMIYVIPDFQNPSGRTWSLERRKGLIELANRFTVPVIEDSPYGELRFEGEDIPSIKSLDTEGLVVHLGTFSKTFCPGLRVAWLAAEPELRRKYELVKQGTDLHTSTLTQLVVLEYLNRFDIDANIQAIRDLYKQRREVMLECMDEMMPEGVRYTRPQGGMFLWLELPEGAEARVVLERCLKEKVAFVPGSSFFPNGGHENTLRVNYSVSNPEKIRIGMEKMARVIREYLGEMVATG
jgi:DNA-binding transcriptional MocR family regulator